RQILPDGTEQVFIFRSAFWQYFDMLPPDSIRPEIVRVRRARERAPLLTGKWYCFVGRWRFDRLYSTAVPSKPTAQAPASSILLTSENPRGAGPSASPEPPPAPPDPEEWLLQVQAEFAQVPRKQRSAWVRDQAFPRMQQELKDKAPWKNWESLK